MRETFGVIPIHQNVDGTLRLQLVQRRDTLSYIQLIRGAVDIENIEKYLHRTTAQEKTRMLSLPFADLWRDLFNQNTAASPRFSAAMPKFDTVVELLGGGTFDSIELAWSFPKGTKNLNESSKDCALREYAEETNSSAITLLDLPPITIEQKSHVDETITLFVGCVTNIKEERNTCITPYRTSLTNETQQCLWVSPEEAKLMLPPVYHEAVDQVVLQFANIV